MLDCKASDKDDPTKEPRFGKIGRQTRKDTGPLTKAGMETVEGDLLAPTSASSPRQHASSWLGLHPALSN